MTDAEGTDPASSFSWEGPPRGVDPHPCALPRIGDFEEGVGPPGPFAPPASAGDCPKAQGMESLL